MATDNITTTEYLPSVESLTPIRSDTLPVPTDVRRVAEFIQFVQWFALPSAERKPKTQKEFAALVGVAEDTLTDWKKRPEFRALVGYLLREWMWERTPDVIDGLYEKIRSDKCGASDVRLFLNLRDGGLNS